MQIFLRALSCLLLLFYAGAAFGQAGGISPPDPYVVSDNFTGISYKKTDGLSLRSQTIDPAKKTLLLIFAGQSLPTNVVPSQINPTNSSVVDQFNLYDGAIYSVNGPILGNTWVQPNLGNMTIRMADTLVTNGKFDRVIIANTNIGSTTAASWASTGIHGNRLKVVLARLAARGITSSTTGLTMAAFFADGNEDFSLGTSQASFAASVSDWISTLQASGFSGRIFIPLESASGQTSNAIRSAQASLWNGTTVFSGGDFDSSSIATYDGVHPNDAGAVTMSNIAVAAMAASGAPF